METHKSTKIKHNQLEKKEKKENTKHKIHLKSFTDIQTQRKNLQHNNNTNNEKNFSPPPLKEDRWGINHVHHDGENEYETTSEQRFWQQWGDLNDAR